MSALHQIGGIVGPRLPPLIVSEVFGPVWQGEGPATGERCAFLRMANCNLSCGKGLLATWHCDTPFTWDWDHYDRKAEVHHWSVDETVAHLDSVMGVHTRMLVISGGEPLLQKNGLDALLLRLPEWVSVDIETNGTRDPLDRPIRRYVVSPKLANSGMAKKDRIKPDVLERLLFARAGEPTVFKFVVTVPDDLPEVDALVDENQLDNVWIMPSGTTANEVLGNAVGIADAVADRGYHLTLRQQVLLFGDERGT